MTGIMNRRTQVTPIVFLIGVSIALASVVCGQSPTTEKLWPDGAPGAKGAEAKDQPTLISYIVDQDQSTGTAIVICPGGGYHGLAMGHEGHDIAKWLNELGISAFICDYRTKGKGYGFPAPMQDARRAIRMVRARAAKLGYEPNKIGVLGFSAGGHLASTVSTHMVENDLESADPIERISARPDFACLCYPVIAFGEPFTHFGSQRNLLGKDASETMIQKYSNEKQVTANNPPTFLWHTTEDKAVLPQNSIAFYMSLKKAGVPAELHIYEKGRHGLGLAKNVTGTNEWPQQFENWLKQRGLIK